MGDRVLFYLLAIVIVLLAALGAFGIPALLHIQGTASVLFIVLVLLAGLAAAAALLWFRFRAKKEEDQAGSGGSDGAGSDVDLLINDANSKLRGSQQGAKSLDAVPLVYILGEGGSGKTTTVLRSGLNPELLAGTAPREADVAPTPVLNLWFTQQAAVLELGESVRQSEMLLTHLVQRTRSKAYRSAFGSGATSRAAVVCLGADQLLLGDGGATLLASARQLGGQLRQISRLIGTPLPVYVIVTKLDRVPHFEEYVRNLSNEEARQLLGSSLARIDVSAGTYADQASRVLTPILEGLCNRLAEFRVEMLDRETVPSNSPGVYEFPREFGKLRKNLNQYLVELCKPSQLNANPYLRGIYCIGIRAQIVERVANAPAVESRPIQDAGATQYINLSAGLGQTPARPAPVSMGPSRVPQWLFLPRLFPEVILGDESALSATRQTAPARTFRRIVFCTLSVLLLAYMICLTVSFAKNAGLESTVETAAKALPVGTASPSLTDLQNLDQIRQAIVQLEDFQLNGPRLSYRFGLYHGDELLVRARQAYFDRFRTMLLTPTQSNWVSSMRALPDAPASNSDFSLYVAAYNPLKAYLITTSNPEKSSATFLTPVFLQYWIGSQQMDGARQALAQRQIDFYAGELLRKPPYSIAPDTTAVQHTRGYLHNFLAEASIYQAMLNDADKNNPSIDFNRQYPGSAAVVTEDHVVRGAFTKTGFDFMQGAILHPEKYANGETWVLGDQGSSTLNLAGISSDLATLYTNDYIKEWHLFLTGAHVVGCGSAHEAPARLNGLAGPASPLLELFYTVSHNTAVANPQIKTMFQPTQALVDPNATDRYIGPGNTGYVNALVALAGALDLVAQNPAAANDPNAFTPVTQSAIAAGGAAQQAAQAFNVDPQFHTDSIVQGLMQAPIQCVTKLAPAPGAPANGGGQKICGAVNPLLQKYPFNPTAANQATVADVNSVFAPGSGAIWSIYDASLKSDLVPGPNSRYVQAPNAAGTVNPKFLQFFNRAANVSNNLYANSAKSPTFNFTCVSSRAVA